MTTGMSTIPPSIVTFTCEHCHREFTHRLGYALHRPCGPVRVEMAGGQA